MMDEAIPISLWLNLTEETGVLEEKKQGIIITIKKTVISLDFFILFLIL